ncbi:50S ribosomal protein L11 methyltransferase [Anaeropeptidivorans aminofermentans]|uniref:50S ribosomal protein L11 methyltransferase n=1 Tax=Anaeropeptidivorans aminofermentans TaxID=2934315 RepID=UPI002023E1D4|nr:50S ribosomal protein L11 methyltransferase [Anaeropeptidivorans aminofermentans]
MDWIETYIYTSSEGTEAVCALLMENGVNGMQIQDDEEMLNFIEENPFHWDYVDEELSNKEKGEVYVVFYLPKTPEGFEVLANIKSGIQNLLAMDVPFDLGRLYVESKNVSEEDWIDNWKKYYKPFKIGEKIVIKPDWEKYEPKEGEKVLHINPGNLFGTGLHQTTRLCIEQLEKYVDANSEIVDLGCGTGILSIIGLMLGGKSAYAADMELNVKEVVSENALKNNIDMDRYLIRQGNVLKDKNLIDEIKGKTFNLAVVNIVADVIIALSPFIMDILSKGGIFIASGIIDERLEDVKEALKHTGFKIKDIIDKDGWVCVVSAKE